MPRIAMTSKMKFAMERLYEHPDQAGFVNLYTAFALRDRGMVSIDHSCWSSQAGRFKQYLARLTNTGQYWCERHLANIRRHRTNLPIPNASDAVPRHEA